MIQFESSEGSSQMLFFQYNTRDQLPAKKLTKLTLTELSDKYKTGGDDQSIVSSPKSSVYVDHADGTQSLYFIDDETKQLQKFKISGVEYSDDNEMVSNLTLSSE